MSRLWHALYNLLLCTEPPRTTLDHLGVKLLEDRSRAPGSLLTDLQIEAVEALKEMKRRDGVGLMSVTDIMLEKYPNNLEWSAMQIGLGELIAAYQSGDKDRLDLAFKVVIGSRTLRDALEVLKGRR